MGPINSPETSVRICHHLLLNRLEERSSHIWLNPVDKSVFHFCLNSGNIRDTVWRPTLTCHERVSYVTHCIIVRADVLRNVVVSSKAGKKAAHRISKHLVCRSLSLLATCLYNFIEWSGYSPISLHIWLSGRHKCTSDRMSKQHITWISFWRYRVWFSACTPTIMFHNFCNFRVSGRIIINVPETAVPPLFLFNRIIYSHNP
jgi:hypothetical protein